MESKGPGLDQVTRPNLQKWESVSRHSQNNSSALTSEMDKTLTNLRDYLKRLEYYSKMERLRKKGVFNITGAGDNLAKTQSELLHLGRTVMSKTKHLLFLERESDWMITKAVSSLNIKPSETSGILTPQNNVSSSPSTVSCYKDELEDILKQFNVLLVPKKTKSKSLLKISSNTPKLQTQVSDNEKVDLWEFLTDHLAKTNHQLKFSILPTNSNSEHSYACRILHISVQGKGKDKISAKKNAAMNLIQLLIDLQHRNALPDSINPFTRDELKMITVQLCEVENYIVELRMLCIEKHMKPPTFTILQRKPVYTMQCSALGQIALGSNQNKAIAKRLAAKRTIELFKKISGVS